MAFLKFDPENEQWFLLNEVPVEISPDITMEELALALTASFEPSGKFSVVNGDYVLHSLEYEADPELFLNNIDMSGAMEITEELVEKIFTTPAEDFMETFREEILLLFNSCCLTSN